ncbi:hypothetical protein LFM09_34725 [Lentzea alba]|uniref:hypothetical protein n=1 Tax=Lentzea alba TaxID=2714351 RepID=UPI0039BF77B5
MRLALSLLLVLAACSSAPADPKVLLKQWLDAVRWQKSVRFNVEIKVEGRDPRRRTFAGVQHVNVSGGATEQQDVTAHIENSYRVIDYRALTLGHDTYLQHSDLTLPPGRTFAQMGVGGGVWVGRFGVDLSLDERAYDPGSLFTSIDRDTLRLVEREDNRYVLSAGGVPHSGGYTKGEVRLVVVVDDEDRPLRVEQTAPTNDRQQEIRIAEYSQWGTAPDVLRPAAETVAKPSEVVVEVGP